MIGYNNLKWKEGKLFYGKTDTTVRMEKDNKYDHMYWLFWNFDRPQKSVNFYNRTHAGDNGKKLYLTYVNGSAENGT